MSIYDSFGALVLDLDLNRMAPDWLERAVAGQRSSIAVEEASSRGDQRLVLSAHVSNGRYLAGSPLRFDATSEGLTATVDARLSLATPDADWDDVPDALDNCPSVANHAQEDTNGDGIGDACSLGAQ